VFKTKKFELTVNVTDGVTGTPEAGVLKHKKGTNVSYSYSLAAGYEQLSVKLDGTEVPATGSFEMDAAHTLSVSAVKSVTGTYNGTSNQGYPIQIKVTKVGGISTITYIWIKMKGWYGTNWLLYTTWGNINTQILNHAFSYSNSKFDLTGNFVVNGTTTVNGTWDMHYLYFGYNFTANGTFNATKAAKSTTKGYTKLRPGELKSSAELYENGKLVKRIDD